MGSPGSRAAQYVRMSTERQHLSIELQDAQNRLYGDDHGFEIVATYADPGISGLTYENRPGLRSLLADVLSGTAPFAHILVFDVSRWGRFQDPDEAAHYEFLCRAAGLTVHYTTESFTNDGTLADALLKQVKRFMAADFSRDLSGRIRRVHAHLHERGFHRGGGTPYGFVRIEVTARGVWTKTMATGERKSFLGSRTVMAPGPPDEVAVVRRIFQSFVGRQRTTAQIARGLNQRGACRRSGLPWTAQAVRALLSNEVYGGVAVLGKERFYLRRRIETRPPSEWKRRLSPAGGIVSHATWAKAAKYLEQRRHRYVSDDVLLADLRAMHAKVGRMSANVIVGSGGYSVALYKHRFGSLAEAYMRAGLAADPAECRKRLRAQRPADSYRRNPDPGSDQTVLRQLARVLDREGRLSNRIIAEAPDCPSVALYRQRFGGLRRAYALVGYRPTRVQDLHMEIHGQDITSEEAEALRLRSLGPGGALGPADADRGGNQHDHQEERHDDHAPPRGAGLEPPSDPDHD